MSNNLTEEVVRVAGLDVSYENSVCVIKLNRPKRRNAMTLHMYDGIQNVLNSTASNDSIKLVYLTGNGEYFTSGMDIATSPSARHRKDPISVFKGFVEALINYPKVIVVGVNGPAIGIGVTLLGIVDFVFASDAATFQTPFVKLGLIPEGCSSYTFPKIMGHAQANEILIGSRKLTATEAYDRKLVTGVFRRNEFEQKVSEKIKYLSSLPFNSMKYSKALVFGRQKEILLKVNEEECARLGERFTSEEFMNAVVAFMAKSSKM